MSLTKSDLSKINKVFDKRFDLVDKRFDSVDKRLKSVEKTVKRNEKGIKKNYQNTNMVIDFFDKGYLNLRAEVERIKRYIKMPSLTT